MDHDLIWLLPDRYGEQIRCLGSGTLEEIRLASGQAAAVRISGEERLFWPRIQQSELEAVVQRACRQSIYAHAETLRQGYLPLDGGHRMGICGAGVLGHGRVDNLTCPSSLVIRVANQVPGCADGLCSPELGSLLILGPPGSGKTTLLRDLVRQISDGLAQRVGVADERGEISAMVQGVPQLQIGSRTDVMVNVPKAEAVMMLLRTMTPGWIALDEITAPQDLDALVQAAYCGVKLIATAHGDKLEDLSKRPLYRKLMETEIFPRVVLLDRDKRWRMTEVGI